MESKLEPCPWCKELGMVAVALSFNAKAYQVHCYTCGAWGPMEFWNQSQETAIAAWNRRTNPTAPSGESRGGEGGR